MRGSDRWLNGGLGGAIAIVCYADLTLSASQSTALTLEVAAVGTFGAVAVAMRRHRPLLLALAFSTACLVPGLLIGARWWSAPADSLVLSALVLAFTVGADVNGLASGIGLIALCVGSSGGEISDLLVRVVFTVPAWGAGTAMRSRALLTAQLAERARELDEEREAYAREAVRYERARIARDLHDVVAHNLSMIVVQAGAGRRALASDPATAAESLRHIASGAAQAEHEMTQLVDLLGKSEPAGSHTGLGALDALVDRASATGLAISYAFSGDQNRVSEKLADAAFHVTQEGITNALKHAPGAPIDIVIQAGARRVSVAVDNGPPGDTATTLQSVGGAHGIAGLRDRVAAVGGELEAGPTPQGGWRITVEMPVLDQGG